MKKFIPLLIILCMLTSCKPSELSDEMYDCGITALKAVDDYIDRKIDYQEAFNILKGMSDRAGKIQGQNDKEKILNSQIGLVKITVDSAYLGIDTQSELIERRNRLAEGLGENSR